MTVKLVCTDSLAMDPIKSDSTLQSSGQHCGVEKSSLVQMGKRTRKANFTDAQTRALLWEYSKHTHVLERAIINSSCDPQVRQDRKQAWKSITQQVNQMAEDGVIRTVQEVKQKMHRLKAQAKNERHVSQMARIKGGPPPRESWFTAQVMSVTIHSEGVGENFEENDLSGIQKADFHAMMNLEDSSTKSHMQSKTQDARTLKSSRTRNSKPSSALSDKPISQSGQETIQSKVSKPKQRMSNISPAETTCLLEEILKHIRLLRQKGNKQGKVKVRTFKRCIWKAIASMVSKVSQHTEARTVCGVKRKYHQVRGAVVKMKANQRVLFKIHPDHFQLMQQIFNEEQETMLTAGAGSLNQTTSLQDFEFINSIDTEVTNGFARKLNFSSIENECLLNEVKKRSYVLLRTAGFSHRKKQQAWQAVADSINTINKHVRNLADSKCFMHRTPLEVKQRWHRLRGQAQNYVKALGQGYTQDLPCPPHFSQIMEIVGISTAVHDRQGATGMDSRDTNSGDTGQNADAVGVDNMTSSSSGESNSSVQNLGDVGNTLGKTKRPRKSNFSLEECSCLISELEKRKRVLLPSVPQESRKDSEPEQVVGLNFVGSEDSVTDGGMADWDSDTDDHSPLNAVSTDHSRLYPQAERLSTQTTSSTLDQHEEKSLLMECTNESDELDDMSSSLKQEYAETEKSKLTDAVQADGRSSDGVNCPKLQMLCHSGIITHSTMTGGPAGACSQVTGHKADKMVEGERYAVAELLRIIAQSCERLKVFGVEAHVLIPTVGCLLTCESGVPIVLDKLSFYQPSDCAAGQTGSQTPQESQNCLPQESMVKKEPASYRTSTVSKKLTDICIADPIPTVSLRDGVTLRTTSTVSQNSKDHSISDPLASASVLDDTAAHSKSTTIQNVGRQVPLSSTSLNPHMHAATGTVYSTGGDMHKGVNCCIDQTAASRCTADSCRFTAESSRTIADNAKSTADNCKSSDENSKSTAEVVGVLLASSSPSAVVDHFREEDCSCLLDEAETGADAEDVSPDGDKARESLPFHEGSQTLTDESACCHTQEASVREGLTNKLLARSKKTEEKKFCCKVCGTLFRCKSSLAQHKKEHRGKRSCDICMRVYTNAYQLQRHRNKHLGIEDKDFQCDVCGQRYASKYSLQAHMRTHTGDKPYCCRHCSRRFARVQSLRVHMAVHTGKKSSVCDICGEQFMGPSKLRQHQQFRHNGVKFQCEYCEKAYCDKYMLARHQRIHTGNGVYRCEYCEKALTTVSRLVCHVRTHTGEKPFSCDICKKAFARSDALFEHKRTHRT